MYVLQVRSNVLDVSYHVSQYQEIIGELKEEISRLKGKITGGKQPTRNPNLSEKELEAERRKDAAKLKRLKDELLDMFREQMNLRYSRLHNFIFPSW